MKTIFCCDKNRNYVCVIMINVCYYTCLWCHLIFIFIFYADPRTSSFPFISNPTHICLVLFAYAYFVLKYGRQYMEHRKPYSLKTFIFYYNIFQIVSNVIIVYGFYTSGWTTEFTLGCEPVRYTTRPIDMRVSVNIHVIRFALGYILY